MLKVKIFSTNFFDSCAFYGLDTEPETFLGLNGIRCARCHFRAQKSLDFKAHPFKRPSLWIYPHPNPYVPPHINNSYINI
jgi:hypothetical protein